MNVRWTSKQRYVLTGCKYNKNTFISFTFSPISAQIHKPGVKLDYITKIPITIIDRIDTTEMYCFTRKEDEVLQTIGCLGVKPGAVFCKADIERGCYIPGENIR